MSAQVNDKLLEDRLAALESARAWSPRVVSKLESHIRSSDDREVFRINPLAFAADKGVAETETVDLFLHATALGLFEMNWMLLCPLCACVLESFQTLRGVHNHYGCNVCMADFEAKLDEFIAVTFTVNPAIRDTAFHHPESLSARDYFFEYRSTPDGLLPDGTPFVELQESFTQQMAFLPPGETTHLTIDVDDGVVIAASHEGRAAIACPVEGPRATEPQVVEVEFGESMRPREMRPIAPGRVTFAAKNVTNERGAFMVTALPPAFAGGPVPLQFVPFLTGKRLLTSQTFRELFRTEVIQAREGLAVTDITLLFTDLKESTSLYDRIGDLSAFSLVQQHFDRLLAATVRHDGAIIKTIGDAVMAAFLGPADAVGAALDMLDEIAAFNESQSRQLILKIGVHKGAAIAVTLNDRLDYFGQTVNIASRVQDLADADEIFISDDVFHGPGVEPLLAGTSIEPQVARVKGLHGDLRVFRIRRAAADRPAA